MNTGTPEFRSGDPVETAAVEAMYRLVGEMAALLHGFEEARDTDPSGGFTVG
ncbi:hypothetical protein [Nocardia carnea]|uniref:hypothetical protein n=1 Tax=Nocardia carnea TaxID=37328 RepID=UPI002456E1BA|nr:hypothetical protein [Nocardia carnea]